MHVYDALCEVEPGVADWAERTFPEATLETVLKHLRREEDELAEAVGEQVGPELADCWMILAHLHRLADRAAAYLVERALDEGLDLAEEVKGKMAVNRARRWGEPDADGVVEHVREDSPRNQHSDA